MAEETITTCNQSADYHQTTNQQQTTCDIVERSRNSTTTATTTTTTNSISPDKTINNQKVNNINSSNNPNIYNNKNPKTKLKNSDVDDCNSEIILNNKSSSHSKNNINHNTSSTKSNRLKKRLTEQSELTQFLCSCSNPDGCVTIKDILKAFNAPISEEQAWALIFQSVRMYRDAYQMEGFHIRDLRVPCGIENFNVHKDGTVHINLKVKVGDSCTVTSHKKILMKLGIVVYTALDYNLPADEECIISQELEQLISHMTAEDNDDEGIERDSEDVEDEKCIDTKELDYILELCTPRVQPAVPEDHYKAVCRALVTESLELRIFLQKVFEGDAESLRIKADAQASTQELAKLEFSDWARFWMQVVDELRRGVRLKKREFSRTPIEYSLTPYEILMEDIRSRKYNLRKVMVNGDIPPRVKKDAHAVILEFIRSRPPLKKASDRKLAPPVKRTPSPREQLMDSIRKGRILKPIQPRLKNRLLPTSQVETVKKEESTISQNQSPRTKQRLIKVDFSLLQDDDLWSLPPSGATSLASNHSSQSSSSTQMPPYPTTCYNNENNPNNINTVLRRTKDTITHDEYHRFCDNALESYDLATQCESRRASMRRHTIVGCQSNISGTHSTPPSRPDSRQSDASCTSTNVPPQQNKRQKPPQQQLQAQLNSSQPIQKPQLNQEHQQPNSIAGTSSTSNNTDSASTNNSNLPSMESWSKNSLDEKQWTDRISDRLSLTLEEIVHIRSVMTKAELEGLPVGIRVKEDVERRKVCFLCLRTRFSIFGPWGIQCKLCQRTVCSKCYTKMRIPTEHFRNVPVVLLSPSLMNSPVGSNAPSPSHHANATSSSNTGPSSLIDESFPKSLMERLLRPESDRKIRNTVGSAPSSPKHQRSTISTPGSGVQTEVNLHEALAAKQQQSMTKSLIGAEISSSSNNVLSSINNGTSGTSNHYINNNKENNGTTFVNGTSTSATAINRNITCMSRSMEGPKSLPVQSPARPHSNSSTLDRKNRFTRAFTLSSSAHLSDQKESLRGELMAVCNDCRGLVLEIIRSSRQTRSSARNRALKNLTLDLSPVYKRW